MKRFIRLSHTTIAIALIVLFSGFATQVINSSLPWENGMLNGKIEVTMNHTINKVSSRSIEGELQNNQKKGSWKIFNKKHKIIQERFYLNNYEYTLKTKDGEVASSYKLERNDKDCYIYDSIAEENVAYSRRMWLVIPDSMLYTHPNFGRVMYQVDLTKQKAYSSYELKETLSSKNTALSDLGEMKELRIMGDFFYDNKRKLSEFRVLAISPLMNDSNIKESWYFYPDLRTDFAKIQVESENPMIFNLDDLFFFGEYPYLIYKVENVEDVAFDQNKLMEETLTVLKENLMIEAAYWAPKN